MANVRRRLAVALISILGLVGVSVLVFFLWPVPAPAQFTGFVGLQTVSVKVFTNQATAGASSVTIPNIGATSHWLTYCVSGGPTSLQIQLQGSLDGVNFIAISHIGSQLSGCSVLQGAGYWPLLQANILTVAGGSPSINAWYSGSDAPIAGNFPNDAIQIQTIQPATWACTDAPAQGGQSTNCVVAGVTNVRHVVNCVAISLVQGTGTATAASNNAMIRDGGSSANCSTGTVKWLTGTAVPATAGAANNVFVCGLNITITSGNAVQACFDSTGSASVFQRVNMSGYDVQ